MMHFNHVIWNSEFIGVTMSVSVLKRFQVGLVDNYYRQISQNYQSISNYFKKFGMLTKLKQFAPENILCLLNWTLKCLI